jgi:hypothetical protein
MNWLYAAGKPRWLPSIKASRKVLSKPIRRSDSPSGHWANSACDKRVAVIRTTFGIL